MGALERLGFAPRPTTPAPVTSSRSDRHAVRRLAPPMVRSGTPLEVAELAWIGEGVSPRDARSRSRRVAACRNLIVGTVVQLGALPLPRRRAARPRLPALEARPVDDAAGDARRHRRRPPLPRPRLLARPRPRRRGLPAPRPLDAGRRRHPEERARPAAPTPSSTGYRIAGVDDVVEPADVDPLRLADPRRPRRRRPHARPPRSSSRTPRAASPASSSPPAR